MPSLFDTSADPPDEPAPFDAVAERQAALQLALAEGIGPRIRQRLLERFGSPAAVLAATPQQWRETPGIGPQLARSLAAASAIDAAAELAACSRAGIDVLLEGEPAYPRALAEIPDPPGVLFLRGRLLPGDALSVAIVGTRHATHYGLTQAERLAGALARAGLTIVSGLARGIDAAAHRGALQAGGRTLAVLASGVSNIYPPEHEQLADDVAAQGALVSEAPPQRPPLSGAFPQRNRIITGLSLGVLVIEAADRSGALISARHAMEQGREVMAIPGRIDSRTSRGCHRLIRDGARLIETVDDVLETLGPLVEAAPRDSGPPVRHAAELQLNEPETQVLGAIRAEPTSIDQVIAVVGLPAPRVLATISILEMKRLIRRVSGNFVARV